MRRAKGCFGERVSVPCDGVSSLHRSGDDIRVDVMLRELV